MRGIRLGSGFAVFIIFFGAAVIQAFKNRDWLWASLWLLIGTGFFLADNMSRKKT